MDPTVTTYHVVGMTCDHCVAAVTGEINRIDGVMEVSVDLHPGAVSDVVVTTAGVPDPALIAEAIGEAGYDLAPS